MNDLSVIFNPGKSKSTMENSSLYPAGLDLFHIDQRQIYLNNNDFIIVSITSSS